MTDLMAGLRQSGSFVAGLLIGISIVVATLAQTDAGSGVWPILSLLAAPFILAIGLALQLLVTVTPKCETKFSS